MTDLVISGVNCKGNDSDLAIIRRKEIVRDLRKKAEDDKVALRNIRRDAIDKLKKLEKDKAITEDDLKKYEKDVQDATKSFEIRIDEAVAHKEKEVMEV